MEAHMRVQAHMRALDYNARGVNCRCGSYHRGRYMVMSRVWDDHQAITHVHTSAHMGSGVFIGLGTRANSLEILEDAWQ